MANEKKKAEEANNSGTGPGVNAIGQAPPAQQVELISLPRTEWERAMEVINQIGPMKEEMEILRSAADRGRVQDIQEKLKKPGNSIVKIRTIRHGEQGERKLVVAWHMTKNDVYIDPANRRETVNQVIELLLQDNSRIEIPYNDLGRFTEDKVLAEVVGMNKDKDVYTVKLLDGSPNPFEIATKYLN